MSGFLLDPCAISDARKRNANRGLAAFLRSVHRAEVFISTFTIGEIRVGIDGLDHRDPRKAQLESWLISELPAQFSGRILAFDADVADRWGRMIAAARRQQRRFTITSR